MASFQGIDTNRESDAADFAKVLGRWSTAKDDDPTKQAREAAQELVAVTFVQPILKQLRESNHAAEPFGPTDGEKQFQSMHDAVLSQRIVKASNVPLVDRLAADLLKNDRGELWPRRPACA